MSISGLFLVLFLFIHVGVNCLSLISDEAFEAGCEFMSLPIVTVMVPVLALGFIIHVAYALILNFYNLKARGPQRYAVANKGKSDDWASKNMFVLGIIILGVLAFHLTHFWAHMQLPELTGGEAQSGPYLLYKTFQSPVNLVIYLVWFAALWFHLTHGFWSAFQTLGINNYVWLKRWKAISYAVATLLVLGFVAVALKAAFCSPAMASCC